MLPTYAPLAQLVEHLTLNQGVCGSSPQWCTTPAVSNSRTAGFLLLNVSDPRLDRLCTDTIHAQSFVLWAFFVARAFTFVYCRVDCKEHISERFLRV